MSSLCCGKLEKPQKQGRLVMGRVARGDQVWLEKRTKGGEEMRPR